MDDSTLLSAKSQPELQDSSFKRGLNFTPDDSIEITITPNAGACFGVVRAIKLGGQALKKRTKDRPPIYSLGPLIHNPMVVKELTDQGINIINSIDSAKAGSTVILRSHGIPKELEQGLKDKSVGVVDATCPLVKKPQRIAANIAEKNHFLIIVGDKDHPEVKGVLSYYGKPSYLVTYNPEEVYQIPHEVNSVGILAQTTIEIDVFNKVVNNARARFKDVTVFNTICNATSVRQTESVELARNAEVVVVVGGKNSSNTCKLVKLCKELQPCTYHIEELNEIDSSWFAGKKKIGVTGGASTPHDYVDSVGVHIANLLNTF